VYINVFNPNHCPTATALNISTPVGSPVNVQLQAADADNDALTYTISQNPLHGTVTTSASGAAIYKPAGSYKGTDQFKYKASDGKCDAETTVSVSIVLRCPNGNIYWKNHQEIWPVSSLLLGTRSYTKSQLLALLKAPASADASLILADQLIAAKLNLANGSPVAAHLSESIAAADALIGGNLIPMKVKLNSPAGKQMIVRSAFLLGYNSGLLTQGCSLSLTTKAVDENEIVQMPVDYKLEQNYPNPYNSVTTIGYQLPTAGHAQLKVYDVSGRTVATLVDKIEDAGYKTVKFDAGNLSAGVYYYRLDAGEFFEIKKMILAR